MEVRPDPGELGLEVRKCTPNIGAEISGVDLLEELDQDAVNAFRARDRLLLALATGNTCFRVDVWETGFYRIATGAGVPIGLAYADFGVCRVGVADPFDPTGDIHEDFDRIQRFYRGVIPRHPERFAPLGLPDDSPRGR